MEYFPQTRNVRFLLTEIYIGCYGLIYFHLSKYSWKRYDMRLNALDRNVDFNLYHEVEQMYNNVKFSGYRVIQLNIYIGVWDRHHFAFRCYYSVGIMILYSNPVYFKFICRNGISTNRSNKLQRECGHDKISLDQRLFEAAMLPFRVFISFYCRLNPLPYPCGSMFFFRKYQNDICASYWFSRLKWHGCLTAFFVENKGLYCYIIDTWLILDYISTLPDKVFQNVHQQG